MKFVIRRRRACLGMLTDGGRRNAMWRCTTDKAKPYREGGTDNVRKSKCYAVEG